MEFGSAKPVPLKGVLKRLLYPLGNPWGTETEKMSGANFPDKVEEVGQSRKPEPRSNYRANIEQLPRTNNRTLQRTIRKIWCVNEITGLHTWVY